MSYVEQVFLPSSEFFGQFLSIDSAKLTLKKLSSLKTSFGDVYWDFVEFSLGRIDNLIVLSLSF